MRIGDSFKVVTDGGLFEHAFKVGAVVTLVEVDKAGDRWFEDDHGLRQVLADSDLEPIVGWDRHRVDGRREAGTEDSPRVQAMRVVAESLYRSGFSRVAAVAHMMTLIGTSSRVEREYLTGVLDYVYEEPFEGKLATCRHCGHGIIWLFDRDEEAEIVEPFGFWYDAKHMTEACGGADGDPVDDIYHEPMEA